MNIELQKRTVGTGMASTGTAAGVDKNQIHPKTDTALVARNSTETQDSQSTLLSIIRDQDSSGSFLMNFRDASAFQLLCSKGAQSKLRNAIQRNVHELFGQLQAPEASASKDRKINSFSASS